VDPRPNLSLAELNRALLVGLLPELDAPGQPVLLGCDDSSLRALLGGPDPAGTLVTAMNSELPVNTGAGFRPAVNAAAAFDRLPRPRPEPPPQMAALCVSVLAASRMDYTEEHHTSAYYTHLLDLLGISGQPDWPYVPAFDELAERGFAQLADWLAVDQAGARGRLLLPAAASPRYVGVPVSQTLLRGRDRRLLSEFFWRYRRALDASWNPSRLVRLWGGRHQLTAPAQRHLEDRRIAGQLTAALQSAYRSWDGTRADPDSDQVVWPGQLRLGVNPTRAVLHLTVRAFTNPAEIDAPDGGAVFEVAAYPVETIIPLDWLDVASAGPLRVPVNGTDGLLEVLDSPTMLVELTDAGLESVPQARGRPVWALTRDPQLTGLPLPPARFHRQPLPVGWKLMVDLTNDELPDDLRSPGPDPDPGSDQDGELVGGLPLARGVWLLDHPPAVRSDLREPALLTVDDRQDGYLDPGETRPLDRLTHVAGVHAVNLGEVFDADFQLTAEGLREGIGALSWDLGHPALLRHGPRPDGHPLSGQGPTVTGAVITGMPDIGWNPPVLLRGGGTVHAIRVDGRVTAHWPAPAPAWQRHAGLADDSSPEWSVEDDGTIVWLCVEHPTRARVISVRDRSVVTSDDALDTAWEFGQATLIDLTAGGADERWAQLVELAGEDAED
jgi:hypothetical protein